MRLMKASHTAFAHFAGSRVKRVTINLVLLTKHEVNEIKMKVVQGFTCTTGTVHAWSISGI